MKEPCDQCGKLVLPETKLKTGGLCVPCVRKIYPMWPDKNPQSPKESAPCSKELPLNLDPKIKEIIDKELEMGNEVSGVVNWPRPESNNVSLKYKFIVEHKQLGVQYRENFDPHYLFAEYVDDVSGDTVLASLTSKHLTN